jgi:hypothetical protein
MVLSEAFDALKQGYKVSRAGWPKGEYLFLSNGDSGHVCHALADGTHRVGWMASSGSLEARDWMIVYPTPSDREIKFIRSIADAV